MAWHRESGHDDSVQPQNWTTFTRRDLRALVAEVRRVAASGDVGKHRQGVEVVVESPPLRWWERRRQARTRDCARIAVTDGQGRSGYPVHIRLYTTHGVGAIRKIDRRAGWATSNTLGQAILMMKAKAATDGTYDAAELAAGTVAALDDLHLRNPKRGWRFRVDRTVLRI
jgi:hypothetical protein